MNRRSLLAYELLLSVTSLGAIACAQPVALVEPDAPQNSITLTVSAAASVQDALKDIQTAYQAEAPEVAITYNFGSSGSLAQQVAQGAPADVFLSASPQWMDDLEAKGQIVEGSRRDLLQNAMVLIVPQDASAVADFKDLEQAEVSRVAIGEPESVPAGQYAKEVLSALNLFDDLQPKLVFAKDVRQVLSYVATGNVEAGLVYATDAAVSDQVKVVATAPADTHAPIVYPVAVVEDSEQVAAAQAFVEFLASEPAIAIFEGYGFTMVD